MFMLTAAKLPPGSATVCQAGGVLVAASRAQRACGDATAIRPASSTVPTVTRARGKLERACAARVTGASPVRTSAERACMVTSAACRARPVDSRTAATM